MAIALGDRIRELRLAHPLYKSLRQFADALDKSSSWVSKVERNLEVPGRETLLKIARLLDADAHELLQLAERMEPDVEESIVQRYSEMAGLLRTLGSLTPEQLWALEQQAKKMKGTQDDSLQFALAPALVTSSLQVPWLNDQAIANAANLLRHLFEKDTGITSPPICPETIIFEYLDGRDRLSLDLESSLGTNEQGHPIAGKMMVAGGEEDGGIIQIDQSVAKTPLYPFTLAHEIGHWILHRHVVVGAREQGCLFDERPVGTVTLQQDLQGSRGKLPPEEWQANRFAVHLLMPMDVVRSEFLARFGTVADYRQHIKSDVFRARFGVRRDYSRHLASKLCEKGGVSVPSLATAFKVSREAMAIRLEELSLVTDETLENRCLI